MWDADCGRDANIWIVVQKPPYFPHLSYLGCYIGYITLYLGVKSVGQVSGLKDVYLFIHFCVCAFIVSIAWLFRMQRSGSLNTAASIHHGNKQLKSPDRVIFICHHFTSDLQDLKVLQYSWSVSVNLLKACKKSYKIKFQTLQVMVVKKFLQVKNELCVSLNPFKIFYMDWETGKAYINPSQWLRYWRILSIFSMAEETTVHSQSVENSPHILPDRESNPGRRGGRRERCRSANCAQFVFIQKYNE